MPKAPKVLSTRHRWNDIEPVRFEFKTERECSRCEMIRVTQHRPRGLPWIEFYRDGDQIECTATPPCDARKELRGKSNEAGLRA